MLSDYVRELVFERVDGAPFLFDAGQWVNLVLPCAEGDLRRAYSIASPPTGGPEFELAVTRVEGGPGSGFLHALEPGAVLTVDGPHGFFTRPLATAAPSLFIATGTGITPLRSMIKHAVASGRTEPLWVLFGNRTEDDILYRDELEALAATHPFVRVVFTLSRPSPDPSALASAPPRSSRRTGYVQTHVRELWEELRALGQGEPHAYVCGLLKMVGAVRDLLRREMGVARQQVHTERYD
jgi:ferredoxin-NADP reductase